MQYAGKQLDFSSGISVGLVRSFTLAISLFALASIVFTGDLEPYVLGGTGMFFVGTAILSLFLAVFAKFPAPVATTPIPVALVMIAIAQSMNLEGRELYLTYVFAIFGCTLLTGILFLSIGYLRIANFFRFVPFTVAAGALAGSGILILLMALRLAGLDWHPASWSALLEPMAFWKAFSSVALGVVFIAATKIWRKFWVLPALFAVFCVLFHIVLIALDISIEDALAAGLFLNVDWSTSLWPAFRLEELNRVDWLVVAAQAVNGTVLFIVLLVLTVVSFAQLELGADMEFDWNKEFKLHGLANLLSGVGGGIPGATVASATLPNIALRANTPVTSLVIAVALIVFVIFGSDVLRLMPLPATSAFLISVSMPLISDWLIKSRKRLHITESAMLTLICITIVVVGFLEAIALGLVLSLALFAVRLSQVKIVEKQYSIREKQSRKLRSIPEQSILNVYGLRARIYHLRGYVFFGSAHSFAGQLKEALGEQRELSSVILDFKNITGFDLSAVDSLRGYIQQAESKNVKTILSSTTERLEQEIRRDFPPNLLLNVLWVESIEEALVQAEESLLAHYEDEVAQDPSLRNLVRLSTTPELTDYLNRQVEFEELVDALSSHFDTSEFEDHESITAAGEAQDGMQLLIAGRASVKSTDGSTLQQLDPGAIVEAANAVDVQPATLNVVAEGPCRTLLIEREKLSTLDDADNQLALRLYRYVLGAGRGVSSLAANDV